MAGINLFEKSKEILTVSGEESNRAERGVILLFCVFVCVSLRGQGF